MNDLLLERSGYRTGSALRPALTPWYGASRAPTIVPSFASGLQFGEFVRTQTVTHEAKAFSKEKVEKLENRDTSDGSDGGPCYSDYERVPGTKAGEKGSCRPKKGSKKGSKDKKDSEKVEKKTYEAASVPGKGGLHKKNSDADGDGIKGEGKKKVTDFSDKDGNGKPDAFEVSVTESSSSDSDDDSGMKKKRSNASAGEDCGCGCGGDKSKKKSDCGGLKKTIDKASAKEKKKTNGVIHRANDGVHDYYARYNA